VSAIPAGVSDEDYQTYLQRLFETDFPASLWSEDAIAERFSVHFEDDFRYVHVWGKWLRWSCGVWRADETLDHFNHARHVCRGFAKDVRSSEHKQAERIAQMIESARTVASVVKLAASDRRHAADVAQWDQDPMLLNTPHAVVDLSTGQLRPHRREDYCTKSTAVSPDAACAPRAWFAFLWRVTGGDRRLIAYLQRLVGYALTGRTVEHSLAFLYGLGANGKSTFLNTITGLLGDYAYTAAMDVFLDSHNERHPTEIAALRGARLVVGQEVDEGKRLAISRVKALTGGDPITARYMRQDLFTFVPAFKLVLAGNHKPVLRNVDEAMKRRLHLVPFTQTIPPSERDKGLMDKLRAEWPGILAWAVRGCLRWQRLGLRPPRVIRAATDVYLQDEDVLAAWIEECTVREANAFTPSKQLHASHHAWAERYEERYYPMTRFMQLLEERGFERVRTRSANGVRGLRLTAADQQLELVK
jgi:putative DNA primase/helicase